MYQLPVPFDRARTNGLSGGLYALSLSLCCSSAMIFLAGCGTSGPERGAIRGIITVDGVPLEEGEILFLPTKGPSAAGQIVKGICEIPVERGPVVGTNRIQITARRKTGQKRPASPVAAHGAGETDIFEQYLPPQYNTATTLTVEVQAGLNEFESNLELKSALAGSPRL